MINLTNQRYTNLVILLITAVIFQNCSSIKTDPSAGPKKLSNKVKSSLPPKFQNFDRKPYPHEAFVVANMISVVKPELDENDRDTIATQISFALNKYKIEPQIMVAIIDTESDFKADKVSRTGDISIAQINVEVWNKEFYRMKKPPLSKEKIKSDQQYALMKMAEILNLLKHRYEKRDRRWYARYHSNTYKCKSEYLHKLEIRLKMLATSAALNTQQSFFILTNVI